MITNNIKKLEKAQSFVEFSMSFVLLMLMLAGTVDLGRAFFSYIAIYDGAREGAVFASNFSTDESKISNHIRNASTDPIDLLEQSNVTMFIKWFDYNFNTDHNCAGDVVRIIVRYEFEFTMPFVSLFVADNSWPITATAYSTVLSPACNPST